MEIAGKVALVTGAGSGIGRATALRLAHEGASVVVNDIDDAGGSETTRVIEEAGGEAAFVHADVAAEEEVRAMIRLAQEQFSRVDILVNNAGHYINAPFFPDSPVWRWARTIDVYLRGTMLCMHYAIDAMRGRGGAIVNISSGAGIGYGAHGAPEYAAAKAAVARLTAALQPLAQRNTVRVNCICPGWVNTPMSKRTLRETPEDERPAFLATPASMREPEEIADAVIELVRDDAVAGRVMLYYEGEGRRLLPFGLEP